MTIFDVIDECEKVLGSIYANASVIEPGEIREKVEKTCQLLNKVRQNSVRFEVDLSSCNAL